MRTIELRAHAKINLLLSVHPGLDEAGYHRVSTVMCPLRLADVVRLHEAEAPGVTLACEPNPLPAGADPAGNIAHRAALAMADASGRQVALDINIAKSIPAQAGLGGGSSDAGAVIRGLAQMWGIDPAQPRLREVAAGLGADVPFFLEGRAQHLEGRGDEAVEGFDLPAQPLVLVRPPVGVPTAAAYRAFDELATPALDPAGILEACRRADWPAIIDLAANNLTAAALRVAPGLAGVFDLLEGARGTLGHALLCGSGSCVAAFVSSVEAACALADEARERGWWSCATSTLG